MLLAPLTAALLAATGPAARVAVMLDDPAAASPARAALEAALVERGLELVSPETTTEIRKTISPKDVLEGRLPAGLSVLEADAIIVGAAAYGPPTDQDGVKSVQVTLSTRLVDLATGRVTSTLQTAGVGMGADGPNVSARGAKQAVAELMKRALFTEALGALGQASGMVTLVIQGLPSRAALADLRARLESALAGAPVKELYFAKGLGKLIIGGGGTAKAMVGPDIGDLLAEHKELLLDVLEVANSRILASYEPSRSLAIHALVLEPTVPARMGGGAAELGRYVANAIANFGYARASYQPSKLTRKQAQKRAEALGAGVIVESEVLASGGSLALVIRVVDAKSGRPLLREQTVLESEGDRFKVAEQMLATIRTGLASQLKPASSASPSGVVGEKQMATGQPDGKER